jgi:hypothetical protein
VVPGERTPLPIDQGGGVTVSQLVEEVVRDFDDTLALGPSRLAYEVERHLLLAQLTAVQARSAVERGWFRLPWPEQQLILQVNLLRPPAVDGFQIVSPRHNHRGLGAGSNGGGHGGVGSTSMGWSTVTYLCSWDLRSLKPVPDDRTDFLGGAGTPLSHARLVFEAWRRGELRRLLELAIHVRRA